MNLQDIYNYFLSTGMSPAEAAQATAWQALTNPTGSITQLKTPQKWYSNQEILDFYAPNYSAAINYPVRRADLSPAQKNVLAPGIDPLAAYTAESLNNLINTKKTITYADINKIAMDANNKIGKSGPNNEWNYQVINPATGQLFTWNDYKLSVQDYFNQLKPLVDEYNTAKKQIDIQQETHPYAQRGLPNPNLRYSVVNDPSRNYVVYQPAVDYLEQKTKAQEQALRKAGLTGNTLVGALKQYRNELANNVQKKIDESGITPFTAEAQKMYSVKKGK